MKTSSFFAKITRTVSQAFSAITRKTTKANGGNHQRLGGGIGRKPGLAFVVLQKAVAIATVIGMLAPGQVAFVYAQEIQEAIEQSSSEPAPEEPASESPPEDDSGQEAEAPAEQPEEESSDAPEAGPENDEETPEEPAADSSDPQDVSDDTTPQDSSEQEAVPSTEESSEAPTEEPSPTEGESADPAPAEGEEPASVVETPEDLGDETTETPQSSEEPTDTPSETPNDSSSTPEDSNVAQDETSEESTEEPTETPSESSDQPTDEPEESTDETPATNETPSDSQESSDQSETPADETSDEPTTEEPVSTEAPVEFPILSGIADFATPLSSASFYSNQSTGGFFGSSSTEVVEQSGLLTVAIANSDLGSDDGMSLDSTEAVTELTKIALTPEDLLTEDEKVAAGLMEKPGLLGGVFTSDPMKDYGSYASLSDRLDAYLTNELGDVDDNLDDVLEVRVNGDRLDEDAFGFVAGSVALSIDPTSLDLDPGIHTISITFTNPVTGEEFVVTQNFSWGVLAFNADQDTYTVGETASFAIGVLDDEGVPVCGAEVSMTINGESVPVNETGQCEVYDSNNITPDYASAYVFDSAGSYDVVVTADNGAGEKTLSETLVVYDESPAFVTERSAATRLYPVGTSPMTVTLHVGQDVTGGMVTEKLPKDFDISGIRVELDRKNTLEPASSPTEGTVPIQDEVASPEDQVGFFGSLLNIVNAETEELSYDLSDDRDGQYITVSGVTASAGDTLTISYSYDAPDISPEFYLMGPLSITEGGDRIYRENRIWQIANDNPVEASDTNLQLWLRADKDVYSDATYSTAETTDGNEILGWKDQGVGENHVNSTAGASPTLQLGADDKLFNFHDYLNFDGSNDYLDADDTDFQPTLNADPYIVYSIHAADTDAITGDAVYGWGDESTPANNEATPFYSGGILQIDNTTSSTATTHNATTAPVLMRHAYDGSDETVEINGTQVGTVNKVNAINDSRLVIGSDSDNNGPTTSYLDGSIAEIVIYTTNSQSAADQSKLESYFAMKYGITLPFDDATSGTDYVASDGQIVFTAADSIDIAGNDGGDIDVADLDDYIYDVAMLGKDNTNILSNTKARSVNLDSMVTIEAEDTGAIDDKEYLFWGNNDDVFTLSATEVAPAGLPAITTNRLPREWKVQKNSILGGTPTADPNMGTFTVSFDLSIAELYPNNATGFRLVVDNDSDFSEDGDVAQTIYPTSGEPTYDEATQTVTFTGVSLADDEYFALMIPPKAPGGVLTSLNSWWRTDAGVVSKADEDADTYEEVVTWYDQSQNGNHATHSNGTEEPDLIPANTTADSNFNQTFLFDGSNDQFSGFVQEANFPTGTDARHNFAVASNNLDDAASSPVFNYGNAGTTNQFDGLYRFANETAAYTHWGNDLVSVNTWDDQNRSHIIAGSLNAGATTRTLYWDGGTETDSPVGINTTFTSGESRIGGTFGTSEYWQGHISEIFIYDAELTGTDLDQVESYLALKYGITLNPGGSRPSYIASDGTTNMWDNTTTAATGGFDEDIFGVGRDDLSSLTQTKSKSANEDASVTIEIEDTALLDNLEFMTIANDDQPTGTQSINVAITVPTFTTGQLQRSWNVQETGDIGEVTLTIDLAEFGLGPATADNIRLIVDEDGDFTEGDAGQGGDDTKPQVLYPGVGEPSISGTEVSFVDVDFATGDYFTILLPNPGQAPGGITDNIQIWLRGDRDTFQDTAGTTASDTNLQDVQLWRDQTGRGNNISLTSGNARSMPSKGLI